jgi:hypothetical protein
VKLSKTQKKLVEKLVSDGIDRERAIEIIQGNIEKEKDDIKKISRRSNIEEELKQKVRSEELKQLGEILDEELKDIVAGLSIRGMNWRSTKETVCDKLRQIYQLTDNKEIKELCVDATIMSKKMTKKLIYYREKEI